MAGEAEILRMAMLARLRASKIFSKGLGGRISDAEPTQLPNAWVGVTGSEADDGSIDLLATVHIWTLAGKEEAADLIKVAAETFHEQLSMKKLSIVASGIRIFRGSA